MQRFQERVDDALLLWSHGRKEGAFLVALIAVAAISKLRYPKAGDRDAFESVLKGGHTVRISVEYRGNCHEIEHIFYKWLRCNLVHEGELPVDICFADDPDDGSMSVRAGGPPEHIMRIGTGWFRHMMNLVMNAPENTEGGSAQGLKGRVSSNSPGWSEPQANATPGPERKEPER
jgi:hypothetical protein